MSAEELGVEQQSTVSTALQIIERSQELGLPMQQHGQEISEFCEWYLGRFGRPTRVIEIGTGHGGTAALWCEMVEGDHAQVISVDMPRGIHGGFSAEENSIRDAKLRERYPQFYAISANSQEDATPGLVRNVLGGLVEILFIDGDHRYECAKRDFEQYAHFVKPGGVVLFHDIVATPFYTSLQVDVQRFWSELHGEKYEWNIHHNEWGGLGALVTPS